MKDMQATLAVDGHGNAAIGIWPILDENGSTVENAVQTAWLKPETANGYNVTAAGFLFGRWFVIGEGDMGCLADNFEQLEVDHAVYFPVTGDGQVVAIRGESGLVDLSGNPVTTRDASTIALRVLASPRNLGASKLEDYFSKNGKGRVEEKIGKP